MMEQRVTVRETDVNPGGGRVLHVYDTGPAEAGSAGARDARLPVFWLHGTPQIGAPVRVILVQVGKFRACMVNPEITDVGAEDFHVWDDCFSFPNLLVRVNRAYRATLRYIDMKGTVVTMDLDGPMAELLQHELDHLDGILALDQPTGLDPFAYRAEWEKNHKPTERYGPPRPREV